MAEEVLARHVLAVKLCSIGQQGVQFQSRSSSIKCGATFSCGCSGLIDQGEDLAVDGGCGQRRDAVLSRNGGDSRF